MNQQNEKESSIERFRNVKLVNISKVCPKCGRTNYMEGIFIEKNCSCGKVVCFTLAERKHIIKTEFGSVDVSGENNI